MYGYKVVDKSLYSAAIKNEYGIKYVVGKKTDRPNKHDYGPLCVFDNLEDAVKFKSALYRNLRVFRCRYKKSAAKTVWNQNPFATKVELVYLPNGTVLCDSVTLLEEVNLKGEIKNA